ncbi:MAG: hypothetical protein HYT29_00030 [Parcubacteria group bacterium]|nr:hypothetical protein [Parcubacteria group bacterium]
MSFDSRLATLDFSAVGTEAAAVRESLGGLTVVDEREVAPVSPTAILKKKIGETYGDFREAVGY